MITPEQARKYMRKTFPWLYRQIECYYNNGIALTSASYYHVLALCDFHGVKLNDYQWVIYSFLGITNEPDS